MTPEGDKIFKDRYKTAGGTGEPSDDTKSKYMKLVSEAYQKRYGSKYYCVHEKYCDDG